MDSNSNNNNTNNNKIKKDKVSSKSSPSLGNHHNNNVNNSKSNNTQNPPPLLGSHSSLLSISTSLLQSPSSPSPPSTSQQSSPSSSSPNLQLSPPTTPTSSSTTNKWKSFFIREKSNSNNGGNNNSNNSDKEKDKDKDKVVISYPFNITHITHIGFDESNQELSGLPDTWTSTLKRSANKLIKKRRNSTALRNNNINNSNNINQTDPNNTNNNTNKNVNSNNNSSGKEPQLRQFAILKNSIKLANNNNNMETTTIKSLEDDILYSPTSSPTPTSSSSKKSKEKQRLKSSPVGEYSNSSHNHVPLSKQYSRTSTPNLNDDIGSHVHSKGGSPSDGPRSKSDTIASSSSKSTLSLMSNPHHHHHHQIVNNVQSSSSTSTPSSDDDDENNTGGGGTYKRDKHIIEGLVIGSPTYFKREIHITWNHVTGQFEGVPDEWLELMQEVTTEKKEKKRFEMRKRLLREESLKYDKEERSRKVQRDKRERMRLAREERRKSIFLPRSRNDSIPTSTIISQSIQNNNSSNNTIPVMSSNSLQISNSLWQISGNEIFKTKRVELSLQSLCRNDVFILDCGAKIYVWMGSLSSLQKQVRGCAIANKIKYEKQVLVEPVTIEIIVEGDRSPSYQENMSSFLTHANGGVPIERAQAISHLERDGCQDDKLLQEEESATTWLYKVSGNGKISAIEDKPLLPTSLNNQTCFILDCETDIYVWNGKKSDPLQQRAATIFANEFINIFSQRPRWATLHTVHQDEEPWQFKERFLYWLEEESVIDNTKRNTTLPRNYLQQQQKSGLDSGGNGTGTGGMVIVGNGADTSSKTMKTLSTSFYPLAIDSNFMVTDLFSIPDHMFGSNSEDTTKQQQQQTISIDIWESKDESWVKVTKDKYGHFHSDRAYVVHHVFKYPSTNRYSSRAYFWQGSSTSIKWWIVFQFGLYKELHEHMRTLNASPPPTECLTQSKESQPFLNLFNNSIFIHRKYNINNSNNNNTGNNYSIGNHESSSSSTSLISSPKSSKKISESSSLSLSSLSLRDHITNEDGNTVNTTPIKSPKLKDTVNSPSNSSTSLLSLSLSSPNGIPKSPSIASSSSTFINNNSSSINNNLMYQLTISNCERNIRVTQFDKCAISYLNSRDAFILYSPSIKTTFVWYGKGCHPKIRTESSPSLTNSLYKYLQTIGIISQSLQYNLIVNCDEGQEPVSFWKQFGIPNNNNNNNKDVSNTSNINLMESFTNNSSGNGTIKLPHQQVTSSMSISSNLSSISSSSSSSNLLNNVQLQQTVSTMYSNNQYFLQPSKSRQPVRFYHIYYHSKLKNYVIVKMVPYSQGDLCEEDAFIIDAFYKVFVWIGSQCSRRKRECAERIATSLVQDSTIGHAKTTRVVVLTSSDIELYNSNFASDHINNIDSREFCSYFDGWSEAECQDSSMYSNAQGVGGGSSMNLLESPQRHPQSLIGASADHRLLSSLLMHSTVDRSRHEQFNYDSSDEESAGGSIIFSTGTPALGQSAVPSPYGSPHTLANQMLPENWELELDNEVEKIKKRGPLGLLSLNHSQLSRLRNNSKTSSSSSSGGSPNSSFIHQQHHHHSPINQSQMVASPPPLSISTSISGGRHPSIDKMVEDLERSNSYGSNSIPIPSPTYIPRFTSPLARKEGMITASTSCSSIASSGSEDTPTPSPVLQLPPPPITTPSPTQPPPSPSSHSKRQRDNGGDDNAGSSPILVPSPIKSLGSSFGDGEGDEGYTRKSGDGTLKRNKSNNGTPNGSPSSSSLLISSSPLSKTLSSINRRRGSSFNSSKSPSSSPQRKRLSFILKGGDDSSLPPHLPGGSIDAKSLQELKEWTVELELEGEMSKIEEELSNISPEKPVNAKEITVEQPQPQVIEIFNFSSNSLLRSGNDSGSGLGNSGGIHIIKQEEFVKPKQAAIVYTNSPSQSPLILPRLSPLQPPSSPSPSSPPLLPSKPNTTNSFKNKATISPIVIPSLDLQKQQQQQQQRQQYQQPTNQPKKIITPRSPTSSTTTTTKQPINTYLEESFMEIQKQFSPGRPTQQSSKPSPSPSPSPRTVSPPSTPTSTPSSPTPSYGITNSPGQQLSNSSSSVKSMIHAHTHLINQNSTGSPSSSSSSSPTKPSLNSSGERFYPTRPSLRQSGERNNILPSPSPSSSLLPSPKSQSIPPQPTFSPRQQYPVSPDNQIQQQQPGSNQSPNSIPKTNFRIIIKPRANSKPPANTNTNTTNTNNNNNNGTPTPSLSTSSSTIKSNPFIKQDNPLSPRNTLTSSSSSTSTSSSFAIPSSSSVKDKINQVEDMFKQQQQQQQQQQPRSIGRNTNLSKLTSPMMGTNNNNVDRPTLRSTQSQSTLITTSSTAQRPSVQSIFANNNTNNNKPKQ